MDAVRRLRPDRVIHLAGASRPGIEECPLEFNATGTALLVEALAGLDTWMLLAGSGAVYGAVEDVALPVHETRLPSPSSPYGVSKLAQEQQAQNHRGPLCITRIANLFGPGQSSDYFAGRLVNEVVRLSADGGELRLGRLSPTRDFIDVRDAADAICQLAQGRVAGLFNLGSGNETPLRSVVEIVCLNCPGNYSIVEDTALAGGIERQVLSIARLSSAIGWSPKFTLERSLADMVSTAGDHSFSDR